MTTFNDGPAKGQCLMLQRVPIFLRVTEENGKFDALNNLEDRPRPEEKLTAYMMAEHKGSVHINRGRKGSGFYPMVAYSVVQEQPTDEIMRDNDKWSTWVYQAAQRYSEHIEKFRP